MKNNKKNKKRKNDLRHLSRKELIDLICDMRRPNPSKEVPTIEEAEKEQKRLNRRAAYRQTFRGTAAVLIVVAAISVLVATLWMPVLQIYGSSMSPTLERGADRNLSKEQTSENRRYCCILAGQQASGQTCDRRPWAVG